MDRKSFFTLTKYVSLNILGTISYSCYALADTYFIAKALGILGMTALNFAVALMYLINGVALMLAMGGAIRFAVVRADDRAQRDSVFSSAVFLCVLAGAVSLLAGVFLSGPIAVLMGADGETLPYTITYMRTLLCFGGAFFLNNTVTAFVRNDGAPYLAMAAMVTGSLSNILLDYVFIFPLQMGVFGGALASCLAPIISLCILSSHFWRRRSSFSFRFRCVRRRLFPTVLSYGAPSLVTEGMPGVVLTVTNRCLLSLAGNIGVASFGVLTNTALVATAIFTGIAQGIQPMASHAHSRRDQPRSRAVLRYAVCAALLLAAALYAAVVLRADQIVAVFNSEGNLSMAALAGRGLKLYFLGYLFAGFNIAVSAYLGAVLQPGRAFFIAIQRCSLVIIPSVLLMSTLLGTDGVWLSFPLAEVVVLFYSLYCLRRTRQLPAE